MSASNYLFSTDRTRVLITGFTPFATYETNPSWEGVRCMDGEKIEKLHNITLFRQEIAVNYAAVDVMVPQMWYWYKPHLTIHVGLNEEVKCFVLEKKASKREYIRYLHRPTVKDVENPAPGDDTVYTDLIVEKICKKFNDDQPDLELCSRSSNNAGRYLCEYIYYTSLCQRRGATLFVHVPLEKYSPKQLAQGLERILELCLKQLPEHNNDYYS